MNLHYPKMKGISLQITVFETSRMQRLDHLGDASILGRNGNRQFPGEWFLHFTPFNFQS
jgi:hypothetical protein